MKIIDGTKLSNNLRDVVNELNNQPLNIQSNIKFSRMDLSNTVNNSQLSDPSVDPVRLHQVFGGKGLNVYHTV